MKCPIRLNQWYSRVLAEQLGKEDCGEARASCKRVMSGEQAPLPAARAAKHHRHDRDFFSHSSGSGRSKTKVQQAGFR